MERIRYWWRGGRSWVRLKKKFSKNYDKRVGRSLIVKILNNDRYLGKMNVIFDGINYEFEYESLVSKEDYNNVKNKIKRLNSLRKRKESEDNFLLKNKVYCENCGEIMWVVGSKFKLSDGNNVYYRYYSCSVEVNKINLRNNFSSREIKVNCDSVKRNKINLEKSDIFSLGLIILRLIKML